MAAHHLLFAAIVLCAAQLIRGYSFNNCIATYSNKRSFQCIHRTDTYMSAIVNDLPKSTINLTICLNHVWHIPNNSFVHLPNLQNLRLDHNHLRIMEPLAFHNLHYLKSLNLSFNYISELNSSLFDGLHNLTFLSLTSNKLKQLPEGIFYPLLNLDTLIIRQNVLTDYSGIAKSVSNLTNLKTLDLCFNKLTSLHSNVSLPQSLAVFYVCRNNLYTLGCEGSFFKSVEVIDLSYNSELPTMAFQGLDLRSVKYLRLRSTSVNIVKLLSISNVPAGYVDFSGTGLQNDSLIAEFCKLMRTKLNWIVKLRLGNNGIRSLADIPLYYCPKIKEALDLSHNNLKSVGCLRFLSRQTYLKRFDAEHNHLTSLQSCEKTVQNTVYWNLEELSYRYNRILSVNSNAFYHTPNIKTLKLNINTIAFLDRKALSGLKMLETLRLDNNLLTDVFSETFEDQVNLQTLNLRNNRIAVIFNETFHSLKNLTILDLGGNKITHIQPSGFNGLKSLAKLYLDGNNLRQIDTSLYRVFQDTLTALDLQSNQIRFLSEHISSPFMNLSKLSDLKLGEQKPYGLTLVPRSFFRGLHSLKSLYLTNNNINHLAPDAFDDLTSLRFLTLDNCCVGLAQLLPGVFKNLRNLTRLIVENMGIGNFSKEIFGNLTELRLLQLNRNVMQSIPVDTLESLSKLEYLDIRNIPLSCTCENKLLQNYTLNNQHVQVVYLYNIPCPHDLKHRLYNFDTKVCDMDIGEYLFFGTAAVIFLFTLTPLLYVKLYWKMKFGYYVFRSWFSEQWSRLREKEENCKYDAFISYNSSDEHWVINQLVPNLEGNGSSFKLCLHHRDFELGRDIVDNIVSAVYSSRKTICVVSRSFLQSEWCSLEIQLASYRLFDEHRDVLLLVFLEPIAERQLSSYHRMRKVMLKKTYLQWPGPGCTDPMQAQDLFWNQLRRAMRMDSRVKTEEKDIDKACVNPENKEHLENHISDENFYLLP